MKLQVILISSGLLVVVGLLAAAAQAEEGGQEVRANFKLPNLFNFELFKSMFNKHYNSIAEEMVRQKIFLGRAFRAFISMVKYKHRQVSHYLRANQMSDETPEERERNKVSIELMKIPTNPSIPVLDFTSSSKAGTKIESVFKIDGKKSARPVHDDISEEDIPVATLEDIERQLAEIKRNKDKPGYCELAEELEDKARRLAVEEYKNHFQREDPTVDDFMVSGEGDESQQVDDGEALVAESQNNVNWLEPLSRSVINAFSWLPGSQFVKEAVSSYIHGSQEEVTTRPEVDKDDQIYADLRQDNCMFQPRNQKKCASCYAFTIIAFFEYIFCRDTGKLVAFSEQPFLDCGRRLESPLSGCAGGNLESSHEFVEKFGLELRQDYAYRAVEDTCPYGPDTLVKQTGHIRVPTARRAYVKPEDFDKSLEAKIPIPFGIKTPPDFDDYGGGVDMGHGCEEEGGHGMLIVGHGREDGEEYWLFRNSHTVSWGEQGYYKFSKQATVRCAVNSVGYISRAHFTYHSQPGVDLTNQEHKKSAIKERYFEYLIKSMEANKTAEEVQIIKE